MSTRVSSWLRASTVALFLVCASNGALANDEASDAEVEAELNALIGPDDQEQKAAGADVEPTKAPAYLRQTVAPKAENLGTKPESSVGLRAIAAIAFLGLLGAAAIFLKRKQKSPLRPTQVHLSLVASVAVGAKAQICVVSVGREALLLGVTEHGVTPLRVYPEGELGLLTVQEAAAGGKTEAAEKPSAAFSTEAAEHSFQALLEKASSAKPIRKENARPTASDADEPDELPAHLKAALETQAKRTRPAFDPPEGQASELARRFRNLQA